MKKFYFIIFIFFLNFTVSKSNEPFVVLEYKGNIYEECGSEGHWNEYYCSKKGLKIRKHSFKNIIEEVETSRKKFEAAAKKAVA